MDHTFSIIIAICVVFDPGAAQTSRTDRPDIGSRTSAGRILEID
jgi:hypothetical protein